MSVFDYANIAGKLLDYEPRLIVNDQNRLASVALILQHINGEPNMFFIQRAVSGNDPWSGQIAFPGGGKEKKDQDVLSTACRETMEEVGLVIDEKMLIGRLDDQAGRNRHQQIPLTISCFVFCLESPQQVNHNIEVGASFWTPLEELASPHRAIEYQTDYAEDPFPAIRLEQGQVLWGLTYRFVQRFMEILS